MLLQVPHSEYSLYSEHSIESHEVNEDKIKRK